MNSADESQLPGHQRPDPAGAAVAGDGSPPGGVTARGDVTNTASESVESAAAAANALDAPTVHAHCADGYPDPVWVSLVAAEYAATFTAPGVDDVDLDDVVVGPDIAAGLGAGGDATFDSAGTDPDLSELYEADLDGLYEDDLAELDDDDLLYGADLGSLGELDEDDRDELCADELGGLYGADLGSLGELDDDLDGLHEDDLAKLDDDDLDVLGELCADGLDGLDNADLDELDGLFDGGVWAQDAGVDGSLGVASGCTGRGSRTWCRARGLRCCWRRSARFSWMCMNSRMVWRRGNASSPGRARSRLRRLPS